MTSYYRYHTPVHVDLINCELQIVGGLLGTYESYAEASGSVDSTAAAEEESPFLDFSTTTA